MDVLGWRLSGAFDNLTLELIKEEGAREFWRLSDYKVCSTYQVTRFAEKVEWVHQLNSYAHLLRLHSFPVGQIEIVAIMRDWRKREAETKGPDIYPPQQVAVLPLPLWSHDETQIFIEERVRLHQEAREKLPHCTAEDRWQRANGFALMKRGRKTAVKIYYAEEEADAAVDGRPEYYVEKRTGHPVRCESYCAVRPFCVALDDGQFPPGEAPTGRDDD
jgi:hypothetical protein